MQQRASTCWMSRRLISVLMGPGGGQVGWGMSRSSWRLTIWFPTRRPAWDRQRVLALNCPGPQAHTRRFCPYYGHSRRGWPGRRPAPDYDGREVYGRRCRRSLHRPGPGQRPSCSGERRSSGSKTCGAVPGVQPPRREIQLCANIGSPKDLGNSGRGDGDEWTVPQRFLYLGRDTILRRRPIQGLPPGCCRPWRGGWWWCVLDIGADKQASSLLFPRRKNPAMGMRAILICLTRPQVFPTQLRALYGLQSTAIWPLCSL